MSSHPAPAVTRGFASGFVFPMAAACAVHFLAACATLPPDADPIPASRPGLTDDAALVPRGSVQAEAGVDVGRLGGADYTATELLLRYGLHPAVEARLAVETVGGRGTGAPGQALDDLEVGLKVRLREGNGGPFGPALTVVPFVSLPTGADRLTAGSAEPGLLLVGEWDELFGLEWTGNVGGTSASGDGGRYLELFLGGGAGRELNDRLALEAELVRVARLGGHSEGPGLWHGALGAGWLVHRDAQLDFWGGLQRSGNARGAFVGAGVSVRR